MHPMVYRVMKVCSPELLEPAVRDAESVLTIVPSCINFTVSSFVMVFNNKIVCAIFGEYDINIVS